MRCRYLLSATLFVVAGALRAQTGAPTGTVSGTITAADSQRPMRFAKVTLTPVKSSAPDLKGLDEKTAKDDPAAAMAALGALMSGVTVIQSQTALDGTYTIADVAPGDYYLVPSAPGYVSPATVADNAAEGATLSEAMAGATVLHVSANHVTRGDASLPRGAALIGKVVYDDGSPAAGVMVKFEDINAEAKKAAKKAAGKNSDADDLADFGATMSLAMSGGLIIAITDDRGHFRLAGLPPGDYTLQATVQLGNSFSMRNGVMDMGQAAHASPLKFYAPGTLHAKDAGKITVHAGEERADIEIRVDLTAMRSVSGRVTSALDHHGLNAGTITLTDASDKALKRTGSVDKDGNFVVTYVPAGTWNLVVSDGADTEPSKKKPGAAMIRFNSPHTLRSYEDGTQTVVVAASDVTGVNVELKESKTTKKDFDINDVMGGVIGGKSKD